MLIMPALMLALSACLGAGTAGPVAAPAPLTQTVADEQALIVALKTYDVLLTAVDVGVDAGAIRGERARQVKAALQRISAGLSAARAAQRAGSTSDFGAAIAEATTAISEAQRALSSQ